MYMDNDRVVYICHCIDTEGPLFESLSASFQRLKDIFGIDLPVSLENLEKIQNKQYDFGVDTNLIADVFSKKRISTLGDWDSIDTMLDTILSDEYRKTFVDSNGEGWVYNWFVMDHSGFFGENPRMRDAGFHKIYDHYHEKLIETNSYDKDTLQFHYHPIPLKGDYNLYATAYVSNNSLFQILAHRIIDCHTFPVAYRPGFNTERPDSHWFLEQYIPFDFGNQSLSHMENDNQPDMQHGRFGNWKSAPTEWYPYHPDHDDYQKKGDCKRWITRCLNIDARIGKITIDDVRDAFAYAQDNGRALLSFTNHDFRDMRPELDYIKELIRSVSSEYPDVKFVYSNVIDAMRQVLNLNEKITTLRCSLHNFKDYVLLHVTADNDIFGPQPFLAFKTKDGNYYWDNMDFGLNNEWYYTFDSNTIVIQDIDTIGIAANNSYGKTAVCIIDCLGSFEIGKIYESSQIN